MKKVALMSVTDKNGLAEFAKRLVALNWQIISTGGTYKCLTSAGIPCVKVEDVTNFPEMMDGRLKTLHPVVLGGMICDRKKSDHLDKVREYGFVLIDMVVVNLYNFAAKPSIEEIDIGGPNMLRIAVKNHEHVIPVPDPNDYDWVAQTLERKGDMSLEDRLILASRTIRLTSLYDAAIAAHFDRCIERHQVVEQGSHH